MKTSGKICLIVNKKRLSKSVMSTVKKCLKILEEWISCRFKRRRKDWCIRTP